MLREDARVPIQHLWANEAIQEVCVYRVVPVLALLWGSYVSLLCLFQGEAVVIVGLMGQLKSVYKYKAATKAAALQDGAPMGIAAGLAAGLIRAR